MAARRQNRYFGNLEPDDLHHHDRKLAALRRAEGVNDGSLNAVARRLAGAFPKEIDPESYRTAIRDWLDRGENSRRRSLSKLGKKALSHQKAIALLHGLLDGKATSAEDIRWLKERFTETNPELADSIDVISSTAATTSEHLTNSDPDACYLVCRAGEVGLYKPLIGRAVITQPIRQIITPRDPEARKAFFESFRPLLGKKLFDSTFANPQGMEPHEQYGHKSTGFSVRVEHVFLPGNERVTVGLNDNVGPGASAQFGAAGIPVTDDGEIGPQGPGDDELRVGPRALIEARRGAAKLQVNIEQRGRAAREHQIKVPRRVRHNIEQPTRLPSPWNIRFDFVTVRTHWRKVGGRVDGFKTDDGCRCRVKPREEPRAALPLAKLFSENDLLFSFEPSTI